MSQSAGTLYIVALPIGNIEDITIRAKSTLEKVDCVAAEDTRTYLEFCSKAKIKSKKVISYHDHNEEKSAQKIVELLQKGQSVALVSDAGTPGIADPGYDILKLCFEHQISVTPIPGVSSLTSALSVSPIGGGSHLFLGFLPAKTSEKEKKIREALQARVTLVAFEAPHRILETLSVLSKILNTEKIFVAREITKTYEEFLFDTATELQQHFTTHDPKGEFVLVIPTSGVDLNKLDAPTLESEIRHRLDEGRNHKQILEDLKSKSSLVRSDLYDLITKIKSEHKKN